MRLREENREISYWAVAATLVFWGLTLGWMLVIFTFSAETGEVSSERSTLIVKVLESLEVFPFITEILVRKAAHVFEYAVLTVFSFMAIRYTNMISVETSYSQTPVKIIKSDNEMYIVISFWISAVYAAIDEYHQLFVAGRNGSIYDFLIDMCGSVVVLCIIRVIFTIILKKQGLNEVRYDRYD